MLAESAPVVFLVLLLSVAFSASAANYLSFLDLEAPVALTRGNEYYSSAIRSTETLIFGVGYEAVVYVSTNGYFSIGTEPTDSSLEKFSWCCTSYTVVAPFAADIDTTHTGSVRYQAYSIGESTTGDSKLNNVSSYIRSEQGVEFYGRWMLVAEWNGVPQYGRSTSLVNTFQGVIITSRRSSYAVFLYHCPSMEWSGNAVIGWQISSAYFRNHPLSGTSDAKQVACLNTATSSYNTDIYRLNLISFCTGVSHFGCLDGSCVYPSTSKCDGDSDCADGSDEVACSYNTCDSDEFHCDNGQCIPESNQCDGTDDCLDSSDEKECGNFGPAVSLSVGLPLLILFIGVPICVVCVGVCIAANRSRRPVARTRIVATAPPAVGTTVVTAAQTTSAAAPATQSLEEYYPAEFRVRSQEAPPPYPGDSYPAHPPPVPQGPPPTDTGCWSPATVVNTEVFGTLNS